MDTAASPQTSRTMLPRPQPQRASPTAVGDQLPMRTREIRTCTPPHQTQLLRILQRAKALSACRSSQAASARSHWTRMTPSKKVSMGDTVSAHSVSLDSRPSAWTLTSRPPLWPSAEASRPKRQRRASAKATEALLNIALAADMQVWGYAASAGEAGLRLSPKARPLLS